MSFMPLCMCALSAGSVSVQFLLTKKLTLHSVPIFQIVVLRGAVQVFGCLVSLVYTGRPLHSWLGETCQETSWLCGRALIGFCGISFAFAAISMLNLGEMQILETTTPIFAAAFAWLLLGERWYWNEFTGAGTTVLGVLFVALPGLWFGHATFSGHWHSWRHDVGVLVALTSSASAAGVFVFVRILGTRVKVHFLVVMLFHGVGQAVLGSIASFVLGFLTGDYPVWFSRQDWLFALGVGWLGFVGQCLMTWGLQREKSALSSVVIQGLGPVYALVLQIVFLPTESVAPSTLVGFGMILAGLAVAVVGKWHRERHEQKVLPTTAPQATSLGEYQQLQS